MLYRLAAFIGVSSITAKVLHSGTSDSADARKQLVRLLSMGSWSPPPPISSPMEGRLREPLVSRSSIFETLTSSVFTIAYNFKRFIALTFIFFPSLLLLPLALVPSLRAWWVRVFLWSVEKAGVVWIKMFQYLSHRRDVIGEELAAGFSRLRQNAPVHPYSDTQKIFLRVYGKSPQDFFQEFNPKPIASGSVSQVYEAKLDGRTVAVKVRHPNIEENIERDISIIFGVSRFLSLFSLLFEIPINQTSLKQTLKEQIYFRKEKENLEKYRRVFTNPRVSFPEPHPSTTDEVLIMSFIDAKPITHYQVNYHPQNRVLARLGAAAFFEMLMMHNFIHADSHGGNILVTMDRVELTNWQYVRYWWDKSKRWMWNRLIRYGMENQELKNLCLEQNNEETLLREQEFGMQERVRVNLIDMGMVIELQTEKRDYFIKFLSQIIQRHPIQCARMIYRISKYQGIVLKQGEYPLYLKDLEEMFGLIKECSLQNLQGIEVLNGMLRVIRAHRMKLDGQFATLLTNMLILEAIAKDLDPEINTLRCAVPYLPYA